LKLETETKNSETTVWGQVELLLFSAVACAQYIPAYAKLTDGTGNVSKTAYLQFRVAKLRLELPD